MKAGLLFILCLLELSPLQAHAWYKHETLMPWIVQGLSPQLRAKLVRKVDPICDAHDSDLLNTLKQELKLNPNTKLEPTMAKACAAHAQVTLEEILLMGFVDDPDRGMDRDLELSSDQKYMGGTTGPSSQGYRHMFLGGWKPTRHPILTFQQPNHVMGDAPSRALLMAENAKALMLKGESALAMRVLSWSLHYIQDLSQPFHVVQVPSLAMVPWFHLGHLEASVTNYHWAYEGFVLSRMTSPDAKILGECLTNPKFDGLLNFSSNMNAAQIAYAVAEASIEIGSEVGRANMDAFGTGLKSTDCALPSGKCMPDFLKLDFSSGIEKVTCQALSHAALASQALIESLFR